LIILQNHNIIKEEMGILIDTVRIANFRSIKNLEVNLSALTLLVGANNAGKTTFLKALQLALGLDRRFITKDDFHDDGQINPDNLEILIDVRIVAVNKEGKRLLEFDETWSEKDFAGRIRIEDNDYQYFSFRTKCKFDVINQTYTIETKELKQWLAFSNWTDVKNEEKPFSKPISIPLIFIDAQRDIQSDLKDRFSYLGRLTNKPNIDDKEVKAIETELNRLNEKIVNESKTLTHLHKKLLELNKTVNTQGTGVEISPINKKIRDVGRNLNINFQDTNAQSFPLENHGMGTRSWASLLTLKAYISWMEETTSPYFPVLALEEPEAHLHPNAQRQLFHQLNTTSGQKIISTHSPFVAAQCDLTDLRHFYKDGNDLKVGQILLSDEDEQRIGELLEEIKSNGCSKEINKQNRPVIEQIKKDKRGKLNSEEARKIRREVMNTRGELLFAKAIILFEGETEEQALPILAKEKFGCYPFEMGLNFIGVGGKNYTPFLSIAKFMNTPWYILSDGDGDTEKEIKNQIKEVFEINMTPNFFVLDRSDFEEYLINNNCINEITIAVNLVENDSSYFPEKFINNYNEEAGKGGVVRNYKADKDAGIRRALLDCMRGAKTKYATAIAEQITLKKDPTTAKCIIPPRIDDLFIQIASDLNIEIK
jgi:putative ATP-dependent endonuclease of the OLD family